ncbi:hypothetical protein BC826DRAFT_918955, partial [Russula brevipes]
KFYLKDKWLWVDLSAKVWGKQYGPISIKLIPIPCVFLCCSTTYGFCCRALRAIHQDLMTPRSSRPASPNGTLPVCCSWEIAWRCP